MTPTDLETLAADAIATRARLRAEHPGAFDGPAQLVLVIPREPRGDRMRLAGRSGPVGEVLCSAADGEATVAFDAEAVRQWARKARA